MVDIQSIQGAIPGRKTAAEWRRVSHILDLWRMSRSRSLIFNVLIASSKMKSGRVQNGNMRKDQVKSIDDLGSTGAGGR